MIYVIDDACLCYRSTMHVSCYRSMMHSNYAIYDDACYTYYRSMMHATCYRSMMHATCYRSLMMHAYAIDDACTLHAIDRWCIVYMISMMMHTIHAYDDACYAIDLWWSILSVDLWYICCWSYITSIYGACLLIRRRIDDLNYLLN